MSWLSTARSLADALGIRELRVASVGCALGRTIYTETKRSAQLANLGRSRRPLRPDTIERIRALFPGVDLERVRVRTRCRLPPNQFAREGSIYAMTFGSTIYFRDDLDEDEPGDLIKLLHELVHVDQVGRYGNESAFSCAYGQGYVEGGGELPGYLRSPTAYHRNPLEAEAYAFEARFRESDGRVDPSRLPRA